MSSTTSSEQSCFAACNPLATPKSAESTTPSIESRKITVSFAPTVVVTKTIHLDDFTDAEYDACWYDHHDLNRFRADVRYCVKLFERGDLREDNEDFSMRGLEYQTIEGARRRNENKALARDAVFDEQEVQWDKNVMEPARIAGLYMRYSRPCHGAAHRLAIRDQMAVRVETTQTNDKSNDAKGSRHQHPPASPLVKLDRSSTMLRRFSNAAA